MEPTHQIILESLPPKSPRSKLEPHRELIRELRRKGRTYREVALLFHQRLGLYVAPSTLHSFVKVRAKHRKQSQFELPPKQAVGLSKSGLAVFEVYKQIRENPNSDQVQLSFYRVSQHPDLNDCTYQRGLRELLDKKFIFRSPEDGTFFVNIQT